MHLKKYPTLLFILFIFNILFLFINYFHFSLNEHTKFCVIDEIGYVNSFSHNQHSETERILKILKNEVIDLEKSRNLYINEIYHQKNELSVLQSQVYSLQIQSYRLSQNIISLLQIRKEYQRRHRYNFVFNKPIKTQLFSDKKLINSSVYDNGNSAQFCSIYNCFNWEKCSSNFHNYFTISLSNQTKLKYPFLRNLTFINERVSCLKIISENNKNLCHQDENCATFSDNNKSKRLTRIVKINSRFYKNEFRRNYDLVTSAIIHNNLKSIDLPMIYPLGKRILLSFSTFIKREFQMANVDKMLIRYLLNLSDEIQKDTGSNLIFIDTNCEIDKSIYHDKLEYPICDNFSVRINRLRKSRFCLLVAPFDSNILSTYSLQIRLKECLIAGSLPVVVGEVLLPFDEVIRWDKAVISLPKHRFTDILGIIQSLSDAQFFQMKLYSRYILQTYLLNHAQQMKTLALVFTKRLKLNFPISQTHFGINIPIKFKYNFSLPVFQNIEIDPYLGPLNFHQIHSPRFVNNFTQCSGHPLSNKLPMDYMFYQYENTPWDVKLSSDALHHNQHLIKLNNNFPAQIFMSINHTINEAGTEFQYSLGGNFHYEQFTVVILSYKRVEVLIKSLELLKDLPYLHSVVVIWNNLEVPDYNLAWPEIGVEIKVIQPSSNPGSLNNRFVPYDSIKTEAILSFDDDIQLRHDEIVFAFRIWRENRHKIVGFPARYHSDAFSSTGTSANWWNYNSNFTCQYSMILTGAAFLHKFYLFVYTNEMPVAIRQLVDQYTNCEDIAMNFLISHITREPPLKVTVRWTLSCINCQTTSAAGSGNYGSALHNRPEHYTTRSHCINRLVELYGYNPLLYTQYRADSVLFKTRLPHHKQKCYRYI